MFGFAHPTIAKLIQEMPGADLCISYVPQQFVPSSAKIGGGGTSTHDGKRRSKRKGKTRKGGTSEDESGMDESDDDSDSFSES